MSSAAPPVPPPTSRGVAASGQIRAVGDAMWINVGGGYFQTLESTLRRCAVFDARDALADVFVDRDPGLFFFVLQWLRTGQLLVQSDAPTLEALLAEEEFYGVPALRQEISRQLSHVYGARRKPRRD